MSILVAVTINGVERRQGPYAATLLRAGSDLVLTLPLMTHDDAGELADLILTNGATIEAPSAAELAEFGIELRLEADSVH